MYDASRVVPGLIFFVLLTTSPVWYNAAAGQAAVKPEPEKPVAEKQCVATTEFMRTSHMELLNSWRDQAVREASRDYVATTNGKTYAKSFTGTCLECHQDREKFCDECHNYTSVQPYCWDCHVTPKEHK